VEAPTWVRRDERRGRHSTLVRQVGHVRVDASTTEEGTSMATSRWCQSRDCRRRPCQGVVAPTFVVGAAGAIVLAFPLALALTPPLPQLLGVESGGRGAAGGLDGSG
jgi:hypothetical protein